MISKIRFRENLTREIFCNTIDRGSAKILPREKYPLYGIYPGCRINSISARAISIEQQQRPEDEKALFRSRHEPSSLSGNYFRNRCMPAVAAAGSAACPSLSIFSIGYGVDTTCSGDTCCNEDDRICTQLNGRILNHK